MCLLSFEKRCFTLKTHQIFPSTLRQRNSKTQQSAAILDLCSRKTRAGESRNYRDVIVIVITLKHKAGVLKLFRF